MANNYVFTSRLHLPCTHLPINSGQQKGPSLCTDTSIMTARNHDRRAINTLSHHKWDTYMYLS